MPTSLKIDALILMLIIAGLMLLTGVLVIVFRKRKSARCTVNAQATVVKVVMDRSSDDDGKMKTSYFPILEYDVGGERVQSSGNVKKGRFKGYKVGEVYGIRYNPDKPTELMMDIGKGGYGAGVAIILLGLLIAGASIAAKLGVFG